jgi:hypothetical protein
LIKKVLSIINIKTKEKQKKQKKNTVSKTSIKKTKKKQILEKRKNKERVGVYQKQVCLYLYACDH